MLFTIVIPTFNRIAPLDRCLTAIAGLRYPRGNFEVLVIDDGSQPPPDEVIARHASALALRCLRNDRKGPAGARNCGLRHARGEFVVFTDDDCLPQADWLTAFERGFHQHPKAGLGGGIVNHPEDGILGVSSQLLVSFLYQYAASHPSNLAFFCSNNLAFPQRDLLNIGGFEERFPLAAAEDRDVCARWARHGQMHFVPDALVQHRQQLNVASFWAQHYRYGRGAAHFWKLRHEQGDAGRRLASLGFYSKMLAFPFLKASFPRALVISALFAISQVACAAGYFAERSRLKRDER